MKKLFVKVFLPFCILLLSGYGNLYATPYGQAVPFSSYKAASKLPQAGIATLKDVPEPSVVLPSLYAFGQQNDTIISTDENEENEFSSSKKYPELNAHIAAILSAQIPEYLHHHHKKRYAVNSRFSYTASRRWYLLFRVFRL